MSRNDERQHREDGRVDSDTGYFAVVPEWVIDSCPNARALQVYCVLARYADREGRAFPSRRTLAARLGCSVKTIDRAITDLEGMQAIETISRTDSRGQHSNDYFLNRARPSEGATNLSKPSVNFDAHNENHNNQNHVEDKSPAERAPLKSLWLQFLKDLNLKRGAGVLPPVDNPSAYATACARSGSYPPNIDPAFLILVAAAVKRARGMGIIRLPRMDHAEAVQRWFMRVSEALTVVVKENPSLLDYLAWAAPQVELRGVVLTDPKTFMYGLTQVDALPSVREYKAVVLVGGK